MALATGERPVLRTGGPVASAQAPRMFSPEPGKRLLEDALLRIWDDLARDGNAGCPVCGGRIERGGPCRDCGSELS